MVWLGLFFVPTFFVWAIASPTHLTQSLTQDSAQPGDFQPDAFQKGVNALKQGDYPTAIEAFTRTIQQSEHVTAAYSDRCLAHLQLEEFHEAIADCTKALERTLERNVKAFDSDITQKDITQKAEAYLNRGLARYRLGEFQAAIADYRQALQLHPHDGRTHYNLGLAHFALEAYAEAIAHYDRALAPNTSLSTLQLAQVYGDRGLAKAMFSAPDRSLRSLPSDATADFNRAIQLAPEDERTYYNRGCMRHRWGDDTGAIADFSQAIALAPHHAFAYMQRGILRGLAGDTPGAIADLRQAMTYLCNSGDATACQQARALMQQVRGVGSTIS